MKNQIQIPIIDERDPYQTLVGYIVLDKEFIKQKNIFEQWIKGFITLSPLAIKIKKEDTEILKILETSFIIKSKN